MTTEGIDYINAHARFYDQNTVEFEYKSIFKDEGTHYKIKGNNILIAAGCRPRQYPGIPAEHCITSDDLFSLQKDPGTTLVVGGGYIAVECAGFLAGLGKRVHLLNRSTFLRSMDSDMAEKVVETLEEEGIRTHTQSKVLGVEVTDKGKKKVTIQTGDKEKTVTVDTILVAIGRDCNPKGMQVEKAGVQFNERTNKIIGRSEEKERTNVDHIYAVGDILEDVPELMPVAQQAGKLVARRLKLRNEKE